MLPRIACNTAFKRLIATVLLCTSISALTQEIRYVSDQAPLPVRSGPGNDYRILNKGLPSGTTLTLLKTSENSAWAEVETRSGTRGWVNTQYFQSTPPATLLLAKAKEKPQEIKPERDHQRSLPSTKRTEAPESDNELLGLREQLTKTELELNKIKRISSAAIELDTQNRALVTELKSQRSEMELLRLENVRLQERGNNSQIIDGAIAVLFGVIIALIVPRFVPRKRRNNDGWA